MKASPQFHACLYNRSSRLHKMFSPHLMHAPLVFHEALCISQNEIQVSIMNVQKITCLFCNAPSVQSYFLHDEFCSGHDKCSREFPWCL